MKSLTLQLKDGANVSDVIGRIKSGGTELELSPMSFGEVGSERPFDQLLVIGEGKEIVEKLEMALGADWKDCVVHGNLSDIDNEGV